MFTPYKVNMKSIKRASRKLKGNDSIMPISFYKGRQSRLYFGADVVKKLNLKKNKYACLAYDAHNQRVAIYPTTNKKAGEGVRKLTPISGGVYCSIGRFCTMNDIQLDEKSTKVPAKWNEKMGALVLSLV